MENLNFTIYLIRNIVNNKVYVGKTSRPLFTRIKEHLRFSNPGHALHRAIKKYGQNCFTVEVLAERIESLKKANITEISLIQSYQANNKKYGYNLTSGGDGIVGYKWTAAQLMQMSERVKGNKNPMFGHKHSEDFKQWLSKLNSGENNKMYGKARPDLIEMNTKHFTENKLKQTNMFHHWLGKQHSEDTKRKIAKAHLGKKHSKKTIEKCISSKENSFLSVQAYDHNNVLICKFSSLGEAQRNGFDKACISRCIKGKVKSHAGLIWRQGD